METCCNAHDICYDTCSSDKELCDLDFKRCLYKYCDAYEKNVVSDLVVKGIRNKNNRKGSNLMIRYFRMQSGS